MLIIILLEMHQLFSGGNIKNLIFFLTILLVLRDFQGLIQTTKMLLTINFFLKLSLAYTVGNKTLERLFSSFQAFYNHFLKLILNFNDLYIK